MLEPSINDQINAILDDPTDVALNGRPYVEALRGVLREHRVVEFRGLHVDNCSEFCDKGEECQYWRHHMAGSEETLGWLAGQGLLDPARVLQWLKDHR